MTKKSERSFFIPSRAGAGQGPALTAGRGAPTVIGQAMPKLTPRGALAFVEKHGIVLQAARGPVPSLAEAVAGGPIRGSWWGHPKGREIYVAAEAVVESEDVLVCKLVEGKITYVHRRPWPALVRLASRFGKARLARVWSEHTASGAHKAHRLPFPKCVPPDVARVARKLSLADAEKALGPLVRLARDRPGK